VAEYTSDIRHIAGLNNIVADTLSRPPGASSSSSAASAVAAVKVLAGLAAAACEAATSSPTCAAVAASVAADIKVPSRFVGGCLEALPAALPDSQEGIVAVIAEAALSRIDLVAMAAAQHSCPDIAARILLHWS
jgi:hypothetical protein